MGFYLQSGQQVELTGTMRFIGAFNDTPSNSGGLLAAPEADVITLTLTNAQANFNYLQVEGNGYSYCTASFHGEIYLTAENTHIGGATHFGIIGTDAPYQPYSIKRTLTAGTDYVKGVGFTVKIRAFDSTATGGNATVYGNYLAVEGAV